MRFQTMTLLAIPVSVMAHPHASRHRHHLKASGGGNVIAPTGGMYGVANETSAYGLTGTGFATGTSAVPTETAAGASDASACDAGSNSTTTVYSTDLVTLTVTAEDTVTVQTSSVNMSEVATASAASNATAPTIDETQSSSVAASQSATIPGESSADVISTAEAETSSAGSYATSAFPISSAATIATSASPLETSGSSTTGSKSNEEPSVDLASTAAAETSSAGSSVPSASSIFSEATSGTAAPLSETADSPVTSSESDSTSSSSTTNAPGGFYEASQSQSAGPSSSAPATSSVPPVGSYSTGKRGLAFNSAESTKAFAGKNMGWAYNWASSPSGPVAAGMEYVPMLWGEKMFDGWHAAAKSALASGSTHMLSFNEPDLSAQANMDSATAAAAHVKYMNPYAGQAKIGSPSITNGGPTGGTDGLGLTWMQNFFDKCAGSCKVDFLTFHWYDSAENIAYFKKYVQSVIDMAKKNGVNKVWLTEFGVSGSNEDVAKFLGEALPWMDSNDGVERYAYFMCGDGHLVSGTSLSDPVGKAYAA